MSEVSGKSFREKALGEVGSKRVNSKVKGNKNEVEVAKALSKWTGVPFRRTPASGAIHVPLHWLSGDVFCAADGFDFPFNVETKHYRKTTENLVRKWWAQTCRDAERVNKIPMLIYRENGWDKGQWVIILEVSRYKLVKAGIMHMVPYGFDFNVNMMDSKELLTSDYNEFIKSISIIK